MIYLHGLLGSAKNWRSIALSKEVEIKHFIETYRLRVKETVTSLTREIMENLHTLK